MQSARRPRRVAGIREARLAPPVMARRKPRLVDAAPVNDRLSIRLDLVSGSRIGDATCDGIKRILRRANKLPRVAI